LVVILTRNPFEIFGLTPSLVSELSEKELFNVLKAMYRSLLKTFHPDTCKKKSMGRDRTVELNLAFEALDLDKNQKNFRKLRKDYLESHPANTNNNTIILRDKLKFQRAREERLADGFFSYIIKGLTAGVISGLGETGIGIQVKNVLLGLQDVAIKNNVRHASWLLGSNYKNIEINGDGEVRVRAVGHRVFSLLEGTVLLGCVPKDAVDITPLLERCRPHNFYKGPALAEYDPQALPQVTVRNFITEDNFKKYLLSSLHPSLMESSYLFSLDRKLYLNSGLINLEGVIIKMEPLSQAVKAPAAKMPH
jgi:hypothetical protein